MRDDPFYLFKDKSLEASLGVLSVDGNFENSIAYFEFFVKFRCSDIFCLDRLFLYAYFCREEDDHWKCLWCIPTYGFLSLLARFYFMRILFNGALKTAPYKCFNNQNPTNTSTLTEKKT